MSVSLGREEIGSGITLRPALPADADSIGLLLREAGTQITDPIFGFGDSLDTYGYLRRMAKRQGGMFSWDITTVAEVNGKVVGMCSDLPGRDVRRRLRPTLWSIFRAYGLIDSFRLFRRLTALRNASPQVPEEHYQVVNLAVMPGWRNNGIGTALLGRAHGVAARSGALHSSLTVIIENEAARRFYSRLGYRAIEERSDDRLLRLTGVSGLMLMTRDLSPADASLAEGAATAG